ncbi:MAG: nucleotidyl transferase AbiEii/AbiGii toxin family protein, partial [Myxococcota bacterium]
MIQQYKTALAFKMALEQRLRNEALRSGQNLERLRQMLVFDRFLARVFTTQDDTVILKGGLVLELRLERART